MSTIKDQYKIQLLSLSRDIENKEITVTQAYKQAVEKMEFDGKIADFIEMLKSEGLIDKDTNVKKNDTKQKVVKVVKVAALVVVTYAIVKVLTKK